MLNPETLAQSRERFCIYRCEGKGPKVPGRGRQIQGCTGRLAGPKPLTGRLPKLKSVLAVCRMTFTNVGLVLPCPWEV